MNSKTIFYKRKIEWKVSEDSANKVFDEVKSGSFERYNTKGMRLEAMTQDGLDIVLPFFDKAQVVLLKIVNTALALSSETYSYEIICLFRWRRKDLTDLCSTQYYISIFQGENSIDFFSVQSAEDLEQKVIRIKNNYLHFINVNKREYCANSMRVPIVFHNSAACVLAHEVLGHILEADNYYGYGYAEFSSILQNLQIDIIDDPLISNSPGFYQEDDMGTPAYRTVVFEGGRINTLIGCNTSKSIITNSLRREDYDKPCYPRMSNLLIIPQVVPVTNRNTHFIEVDKLSKCFIYHSKKVVEFNVEYSVLHSNVEDIRLTPFRLKFNVVDLLAKLCAVSGGDMELRPIQCSKHNQVISCGVSSPDWIINYA